MFIVPATANILQRLASLPEYSVAIHFFFSRVEVAVPTRYYTRWTRRLRGYAFTREDAAVLALTTFGMDQKDTILGMQIVVTLDQPMINNWLSRQKELQKRLSAMQRQIPRPYSKTSLPQVLRPEQILP